MTELHYLELKKREILGTEICEIQFEQTLES